MAAQLNLSDLIDLIELKNPGLPPREVEAAVRGVFLGMARALENGARVEIRGFGVLEVRQYDARDGRNPRNGAPVVVPPRRGIRWKTGKALAAELNRSDD